MIQISNKYVRYILHNRFLFSMIFALAIMAISAGLSLIAIKILLTYGI